MTSKQAERLAKQVRRLVGTRAKVDVLLDGLGDEWLVRLSDMRTGMWTKCDNPECSARDLVDIHDDFAEKAIWHGTNG